MLPFEMLGIIFTYYVETETLFHSLETLLLVSQSWNRAAIGHQALWGNLHIHLGHKPTQDAWRFILPRRLERSGSTPLSIEIRYALKYVDHRYYTSTRKCDWHEKGYFYIEKSCSCLQKAAECAQNLLEILAGSAGEHCNRWKKLHITLGSGFEFGDHGNLYQSPLSCDLFSHPTPLLERIHLKNLEVVGPVSQTLFPSIPSIHTVHLKKCTLDSLAGINFSGAKSITIQDIEIIDSGHFRFNPPTSIESIDIDGPHPVFEINRPLPHLHTLYLGKETDDLFLPDPDPSLPDLTFPALNTLTFPLTSSDGDSIFLEKFTSPNDPLLSTVKVLKLSQYKSPWGWIENKLKPFLEELVSVERITASREVLGVILRYIWEANMQRADSRIWSNLSGRALELINHSDRSKTQLDFDETMWDEDICAAGRKLGVRDPRISWGQD